VLALSPDDPAEDVAALTALARDRVRLRRRGVDSGEWVELDVDEGRALPRASHLRRRWREARPWVWRDALTDELRLDRNAVHAGLRLFEALWEPDALERLLRARLGGRGARFEVLGPHGELADPERDLARVDLADRSGGARDLWAKVGRLSTHPDDRSLRLRFSFGAERDDDASDDESRQRAVSALTAAVLPEARLADARGALLAQVSEWHGAPLYATQGIAYWNAPGGGARFHHDAFDATDGDRQRGVLYLQLAGSTAWLASGVADLARRVAEFAADLDPDDPARPPAELATPADLARELVLPGCGRLGPLVDLDPRFTAFLTDCGHATLLGPGDAIVLPNLGRAATAMHSVWCASPGPTYALSFALRRVPTPPAGRGGGRRRGAPGGVGSGPPPVRGR
jgi:hypothetical protein